MQPRRAVLLLPVGVVAADQPQKALRVHFMTVRSHRALLGHRPAMTVGRLVEKFGRRLALAARTWICRSRVRSDHRQLSLIEKGRSIDISISRGA